MGCEGGDEEAICEKVEDEGGEEGDEEEVT